MHEITFYNCGQFFLILVNFGQYLSFYDPFDHFFSKLASYIYNLIKVVLIHKFWWKLIDFEFLTQNLCF